LSPKAGRLTRRRIQLKRDPQGLSQTKDKDQRGRSLFAMLTRLSSLLEARMKRKATAVPLRSAEQAVELRQPNFVHCCQSVARQLSLQDSVPAGAFLTPRHLQRFCTRHIPWRAAPHHPRTMVGRQRGEARPRQARPLTAQDRAMDNGYARCLYALSMPNAIGNGRDGSPSRGLPIRGAAVHGE
jgi:hypothetical protein